MKSLASLLAIALFAFADAKTSNPNFHACLKRSSKPKSYIIDEANMPENKYHIKDVADSLDWRYDNEQRYTTWTRNQHIPNYCGACWAFASISALSDRIMIGQDNKFSEIDLSPQVLLNCLQDNDDQGCHGGDPDNAYGYIQSSGIPSETCAPYMATGWDTGNTCHDIDICKNCDPSGDCVAQVPYQLYYVSEHGSVSGEQDMLKALQDGPIVAGMCVTDAFEKYDDFSIFNDTTGCTDQEHAISIVGYGMENNVKYWIGRNSWGTYWGDDGYFRIVRGTNNLGIEEWCSWATPGNVTWKNSTSLNNNKPTMNGKQRFHGTCRPSESAELRWEKHGGEKLLPGYKKPLYNEQDLPTDFSWGNINDTNFLTLARNQHIPTYCGSCWAFGTTSSIGDRLSIMRYRENPDIWPEINLAPQVLINEPDNGSGGDCNGGEPIDVYKYIHKNGIPHETCQAYQAKNDPHGKVTSLNICENCVPGNTSSTFTPGTCYQMTNYTLYWITQYGGARGIDQMKSEIYQNGPISCGVDATAEFEAYTGGIFSQVQEKPVINHEISVVGWGIENGENYWIGRNSWGTYWGEEGFFRIKMGSDNLGIETDCTWGIPSFSKPTYRFF